MKKQRAINTFVSLFGGSYELLSSSDIYCKVFDSQRNLIAYAEVIEVVSTISMAKQLMIPANRLLKVYEKRLTPTIVWSCEDGIIYAKINDIQGYITSRTQSNPYELMCVYDRDKKFKYVRYK